MDRELGRLCRDGGRADDPIVEASDSEEEAGDLRTLCTAGPMRREREDLDGELGRLCRSAGMGDAAIDEQSESDDEMCGMQAIATGQTMASFSIDELRGLAGIGDPMD